MDVHLPDVAVCLHMTPGCVYMLTCDCSTIGERGQTLLERFKEHLRDITRYKNAADRLNEMTEKPKMNKRGRLQKLEPWAIMDELLQKSAMVVHAEASQRA
ncbi:hypothetical protein M514_02783 [Trichuris suis]|uniref:Uncharacterized protein n=1 Tax=Trichuris suis TaxID=68888 RepID=A0A085N2V0_9BILA|nr:hypothetical protein M513_02783 [Trichuris suis]KFD63796.1 hypothetical protein M514_02783 [Trichuris suis]